MKQRDEITAVTGLISQELWPYIDRLVIRPALVSRNDEVYGSVIEPVAHLLANPIWLSVWYGVEESVRHQIEQVIRESVQ